MVRRIGGGPIVEAHVIEATRKRIQAALSLRGRPQHLSADRLSRLINRGEDRVSKATICNAVKPFARSRLVRGIVSGLVRVFYDGVAGDHGHIRDVDDRIVIEFDSRVHRWEASPERFPFNYDSSTAGVAVPLLLAARSTAESEHP